MSSSTGTLFRISTFGESHGAGVGVVIDGCPPRVPLSVDDIQPDLDRRRPGQSRLVTQRNEADSVEILSGTTGGLTTGAPIALLVRNRDQNSGAYDHLSDVYRPSHADWTYDAKYGVRPQPGGGRSSARETIGRVAAAAIARKVLSVATDIEVLAWVSAVHGIDASGSIDIAQVTIGDVEADPTRCPSPQHAEQITASIEQARRDGDSLGGIVTCVLRRVPAGLGEPAFDRFEADLAKSCMSLPATRGFEIGSGFGAAAMTGRQHNDPFVPGPDGRPRTTTNHSGGVQGGITNGEDVVFRVAFKPTATISSEQQTVNTANVATTLTATGRHDPCVLPRAVPMVEAAALLVTADHWLRQRAIDVLPR